MQLPKIVRGKYGGFEGPMHRGTERYVATPRSEVLHKLVGVTTSTEGGCFDSENGYDRATISLGLVQVTPIAGLRKMLSSIVEQAPSSASDMLRAWEKKYGVKVLDALLKGSSPELARDLYGCTGREGSWSGASWDRAEHLFQALGLLLVHPVARQVQLDFTASKILSWVMPGTAKLLFQDLHTTGWWGALQAAVVSFSANLPAVADKHFRAFVEEQGGIEAHRVDHDFVLGAIDAMTYRPKISIYPHRKAAILPTIERLYGVTFRRTPENNPIVEVGMSPKQVQEILLALRYDLGPAGADGVFGPKTVAALTEYQRMRGLDPDGILGPKTRAELAKEEVPKELPVIILQLNETHRLVQNPRGSWDLQQQAKKGWKRLTTHSNIKQAAESLVQRRPDLLLCIEGKVTMSLGTFLSNLADATLSLEETLSKAAKNQG